MTSASAARDNRAGPALAADSNPAAGAERGRAARSPGALARRRWPWYAAGGVVLVALVAAWGALFALRLVHADRQDRAGLAALEAAKSELARNHKITAAAISDINAATAHFVAARGDLAGPVIGWTRAVPVLGTQVTSLRDLTSAAAQASTTVGSSLLQVQAALAGYGQSGGGRRGAGLLQLVRTVTNVAGAADSRLTHLDLGPSGGLIRPLWSARAKLVKDLGEATASLRKIQLGGAATASLIAGPHTYLVLVANNAEMRAGSGMFLEAGTLTTGGGQIRLGQLLPTFDIELANGAVPASGDLAARWGWVGLGAEWRNLALSPRFDANAQLAAQMWKRRTGQAVDGVMVVDTQFIAAVLDATGPVQVKGVSIAGSDAESFLMLGQYQGALGDPAASGRVDDLGLLAGEATSRLTSGRLDLVQLATGLSQSLAGRHLLLWSADPATEAQWQQLGSAGQLGSASLAVAVENTGANKLDQFLSVTSDLSFHLSGSGTEVQVAVHIANHTPVGLPRYVEGPNTHDGIVAREYAGLVAFTLPGGAVDPSLRGFSELPVAGPDGPTIVLAAPVRIPAGSSTDLTATFRLPGHHGAVVVEPSGRLPATTWRAGGSTFTDGSEHWVRW